MTDETASADAMHYTAAADGAGLSRSVPDPVAHLDPAEASRVLGLAERLDADALAGEDRCEQCGAGFTSTPEREWWCSAACQREWQDGQVNNPDGVYLASSGDRIEQSARAARTLLEFRFGRG